MTAASAFLPGLDGAAVAHCDGGPREHPGAALGPIHSFSFFYLRPFMDPTVGELKPGSAPSRCPPPACPCQPLLGSGAFLPAALPGAVSQLSVSFSPPSPSALPPACIPTEREVTPSPRPHWAGGEGAAGRPSASLYSVQSHSTVETSPPAQPEPPPATSLALLATRLWGAAGTRVSPTLPPAWVPGVPGAPSPICVYNYNLRSKPGTTVTSAGFWLWDGPEQQNPPFTGEPPRFPRTEHRDALLPFPLSPSVCPSIRRPSLLPAGSTSAVWH